MHQMQGVSAKGLMVWIVCAVFFMYEFMLRTVLGTFQLPIMGDLHLTPMRFAILSSTSYQLIYGTMQIPVGMIASRYGLKATLLFAVLVCAIATFGFSFSQQFYTAVTFRILMGLGSAFGFVCLLLAVYEWLPRKNAAFFIGLSQFIGTLGPMMAAGPLNLLNEAHILNWRSLFLYFCFFAVVIAILVFLVVDKKRTSTGKFVILNRPTKAKLNFFRLLRQPQVWLIGIFSASIYFSIEYLSENEGVLFLQAKGFSSNYAAFMITLSWLGYAIGCPLMGYVSDRMQKRKPVMITSAGCTLVALAGIIFLPKITGLTIMCFGLLGIGAAGQSVGFAIIAEHCKEEYLAIGLAFNNAVIMLFTASCAPMIGFILTSIEAKHPLSLADLQTTLLVLLPLAGIAFIAALWFISETYCKMTKVNYRLSSSSEKSP